MTMLADATLERLCDLFASGSTDYHRRRHAGMASVPTCNFLP